MPPLEAGIVEESHAVDGVGHEARADWGSMEVRLTGIHTPLTASRDRRGTSFAVMAFHRPETRYAYRGRITPRGLQVIRELVAELLGADEPAIVPLRPTGVEAW